MVPELDRAVLKKTAGLINTTDKRLFDFSKKFGLRNF